MMSNNQPAVGAAYLFPFFIYFTLSSVALFQPDYDALAHQEGSIVNQITLSLAYSLAFVLLLKQSGVITWILSRAIPLDILFFLVLISLFWSDFPGKVAISFVHNTGLAFIALCMAILLLNNKDKFLKLLLIALFSYVVATIVITLLRPDIGLMTSRNIYAVSLIGRWRGLTSHPNSLGAICLFTTWVALSTFFHTNNKKLISLLSIITLIANFYCLYKTNSMTSTLLSAALVFGTAWFAFIGKSTGGVKGIKILVGLFSLIIGCMMAYILHPEFFTEKYFFRAIGRDVSLSGRASLWEIGLRGFEAKPYFGWSYDSLRTFLKQYDIGYGQLHNGYLDLLVRGGIISVMLFFILLIQLAVSLIRQASKDNKDYVFIAGLIIAVLMHNMTEASIFANTSIVWLMFLIGYFYSLGIKNFADRGINHEKHR